MHYDSHYHAAATMKPILLFAMWFSTLTSVSQANELGIGRPSFVVMANLAKLVRIATMVSPAIARSGLSSPLVFFSAADAVRYVVFALFARPERISFLAQDIACTALSGFAMLGFQELVYAAGSRTTCRQWLGLGSLVLG